MKRFLKFLLLVFCLPFISMAQFTFNKSYDMDSTIEGAFVVMQTLDGGFLTGGDGDGDIFIVKTDNKGNTEWTKYIDPNPGPYGSVISAAIQLKDSSYIFCGTTKDTFFTVRPDVFLFKLDKDGINILWQKSYDNGWNDYGDDLKQTVDGGFIIISTSWDSTSSGFNTNAWLIKTDSVGNIQWDTVYGGAGDDVTEKIVITEDGGFVFAGYTDSYGTGDYDFWLFKTNSKGDSLWQQTYSGTQHNGARDVQQTLDGGFIMAGDNQIGGEYDGYLIKTDSLGNLEWDSSYQQTAIFYGVTQLSDSSYVVAGGSDDLGIGKKIQGILMKTDSKGNKTWVREFTHYGGENDDYIYDMQATNDGGFIMAGMVMGGGVLKQDMWLVKTDCLGNDTAWDTVNCWVTGVADVQMSRYADVRIYPNPFSHWAVLEINGEQTGSCELVVYDIFGRVVAKATVPGRQGIISRGDLPAGIYVYRLMHKNEIVANGKIIVQ